MDVGGRVYVRVRVCVRSHTRGSVMRVCREKSVTRHAGRGRRCIALKQSSSLKDYLIIHYLVPSFIVLSSSCLTSF